MGCIRCRYSSHCGKHRAIKLVHRDSLDKSLWINQYVLYHYRPPKMSSALCLHSMFHWTNETINIWSHLLGLVYFTYCQIERNFISMPAIGASFSEHVVISLSLLGAQTCMLLSATFHIFGCQSSKSRKKYLKLDLFGISAGILSMYIEGIYTSFYCFPDHMWTYFVFLTLLFLLTASLPLNHNIVEKKVIGSRIGWLHIIYTAVILFGFFPTLHWTILHGGLWNDHVIEWLPNVVFVYILTGAAFFFYVSMFPERIRPGSFDMIGCSHQWWHLLILAAMALWQEASIRLLTYYHSRDNFCSTVLQPHRSLGGLNHTTLSLHADL